MAAGAIKGGNPMETAGATAGEKRSEHGSIPETLGRMLGLFQPSSGMYMGTKVP